MNPSESSASTDLPRVPFLDVLRSRRSRRFGAGMEIPGGPLAFRSRQTPCPLTESEESALVFAAAGLTGHALADLAYHAAGGGNIMAGLAARTAASGDGIQNVALVVINDTSTHLVRRPRELVAAEVPELIRLGREGRFEEAYRRERVLLKSGRCAPPREPLFNITVNDWSAHAPGTTTFLPVNDLTFLYINGLLEVLNERTGAFILDERNHFLPAGLGRFAKSKGGHLDDEASHGRIVTVRQVEQFVTEFVTVEQGMILQNLGLMAEALGLGGYPGFANHEFGWFQALDFRMQHLPASRYVGAGWLESTVMKLTGKDVPVPYAVGLEREGMVLLKPFCPPYFPTMTDAVHAVVAAKSGPSGVFRSAGTGSAWKNHASVTGAVPPVSDAAVAATCAHCEYLFARYGRFPVHLTPFRTVMAFQACHLDGEFYGQFYRPEALGSRQRSDIGRAAGAGEGPAGQAMA
jgi:hypothetical protein